MWPTQLNGMASILGTIFGTIPNCKRDPYVYCYGSLHTANIDVDHIRVQDLEVRLGTAATR